MLLSIDERDERPIYLQLANQIKEQVSKGILQPGDELPPVRDVARDLGINLHTVRSAYIRLRDEGLVDVRLGRKARITRQPPTAEKQTGENIKPRFRELITDALLKGLGPDGVRRLVNEVLEEIRADRKEHER